MIWATTSNKKIDFISFDRCQIIETQTNEKLKQKYIKRFVQNLFISNNLSLHNLYYYLLYNEKNSTYQIIYFYSKHSFITIFDKLKTCITNKIDFKNKYFLYIEAKYFCVYYENKIVLIQENKNYSINDIKKYIEYLLHIDRCEIIEDSVNEINIMSKQIEFKTFQSKKKAYVLFTYYCAFFIFSLGYFYQIENQAKNIPIVKYKTDSKVLNNQKLLYRFNTLMADLQRYNIRLVQIKYKQKWSFVFEGKKKEIVKLLSNKKYNFSIVEIKTNTNLKYLEVEIDL